MPFEPLNTDEKLDEAAPREKDVDTVMLIGCGGFILAAVISYVMAIWPYFAFPEVHLMKGLAFSCALGFIPTLIFGAYVTRRHGLAAACGFVGGGMTTAIFLFLRLTEVQLRRGSRDMGQPDYPSSWVWIIPLVWLIVVFATAMLFIKRSEIDVTSPKEP